MSIPPTTFREWTLSAFIIQSALAVSQSGVQRTSHIDNIFREAEYYSLLKNEGNKACIPRCPFWASLPGCCCREWFRGEGRAGVLWGVTPSAPPCCQPLSLPSPVLGQGQPGCPCPAVQAEEGSVSSSLRPTAHRPLVPLTISHPCSCLQPALWRGVAWVGSSTYPFSHLCVQESCSQQEPRARLTHTEMSSSHPGTGACVKAQSQHGKLYDPEPFLTRGALLRSLLSSNDLNCNSCALTALGPGY